MNTAIKTETERNLARPEDRFVVPAVDITETKDEFVLQADMPGVAKNSLEVLLEGNELTVVGHRVPMAPGEYLHRESNAAAFRRTFVVDPTIDGARITAQIDNGVLRVRLPKAEAVKPRRILVKA